MGYHFFSSPPLVGLDIQPREIRLIQLKKTRSQYTIVTSAWISLPEGVYVEGKIREWEIFQKTLTQLVESTGVTSRPAVIALPAHLVRMQSLSFPKEMTRLAIKESIQDQFKQDFPGLADTICMDFYVLQQNSVDYVEVLFAAAREEYISQYVRAVNASGLEVKIVDVDIYAIKRLIDFTASVTKMNNLLNVIIYEVDYAVILLAYKSDEILYCQQWSCSEVKEFNSSLNSQLINLQAIFLEVQISRLIVCSANFLLEPNNYKDFKIINLNPLASFIVSTNLKSFEQPNNFLLACGLAMRGTDVW